MTNREAIENIEYARKWLGSESDFSDEALDMAISALKFKERYDQFWEEVKTAGMKGKRNRDTPQRKGVQNQRGGTMTNKEAIKILQANVIYACEKAKLSDSTLMSVKDALDLAISALEKQDADRWIPVTERLPEESNLYTVTAYERGERIVFDLYFSKTKGWDGWWDTKVIAWRKRPEPYTEEEV